MGGVGAVSSPVCAIKETSQLANCPRAFVTVVGPLAGSLGAQRSPPRLGV
jgi:hypothetical protein